MRFNHGRAAMLALICAGALGIPSLTAAQVAVPAPGTRIRVTFRPADVPQKAAQRVSGVLVDADNLTITMKADRNPALSVRTATISRIERSDGHRSRWRGAVIGALIGAGAGAFVGFVAESNCEGLCLTGLTTIVSGGFGAAGGAVIGAALPPAERWIVIRF